MSSLHSHLLQLAVERHPGVQGFADPGSLLDLLQPFAQGPLQPSRGLGPRSTVDRAIDSLIIIPTSNAESSITENISRTNTGTAAERLSRFMKTSYRGIGERGRFLGSRCSLCG